jgi:hypothetical protein
MPLGGVLPYGPFHSLQGLIPDDATERIDVECSPDLWAHWQEFYDEIQPIFVFPPSDSPIRDHWRYILSNFDTYHNKSRECEVRIGTAMIARYAPAAVVDSEKKRLTALGRIMDADFSNMDNNTIERKMWVCILCEIIQCRRALFWHRVHLTLTSAVFKAILNLIFVTYNAAPVVGIK